MRPLKIYLCDPVHNFVPTWDIWTIPLNVLTIASYAKAAFGSEVDIKIFKFPDLIFKTIKEAPPDVIGVSNYVWNCELSKSILQFAKKTNRNTITVMGGPNVTQIKSWMEIFLNEASCDYYVCGEGEYPFKCLIGKIFKKDALQGVWHLDPKTKLAVFNPIVHKIINLDKIPSPFQNGMADEFLEQGLMPMIETNRGCPFLCTYCDWGDATYGRVHIYSVERVKADIDYCRCHTDDERLMINDANFGLLGERDLEIAKFIKYLRDKYGWPGKVIITWGQTKSKYALQIADIFKDLCMMTQSSQSMNPEVIKNIKRRNISDSDWKKSINFCKRKKIHIYGELMLPLPHETLESYLAAVRYLFNLRVDFINTNPLILLEGAEINTIEERDQYQMVTKWRLLENCYGVYEDRKIIEYQEMVVQTNTFSFDEYLLCRQLSWLIQMSWNLKRHELLMKYLQIFSINPLDFILKAIKNYKETHVKVIRIFDDFSRDAQNELFDTKEALIDYYSRSEQIEILKRGGFRKMNTHYTSRVSLECNKEFLDYYTDIAKLLLKEKGVDPQKYEDEINDCSKFIYNRYICFEDLTDLTVGEKVEKKLSFKYDILDWINKDFSFLQEFYCPQKVYYVFSIESEQKEVLLRHLKRFEGLSSEYQLRKLQEPYHGIHKKHLQYSIRKV